MKKENLKTWVPAILGMSVIVVGMLHVTGVFAAAADDNEPGNFFEVKPDNRCSPGTGAGPRAAGTIYRGARPDENALRYLESIGVKSILNLETASNSAGESSSISDLGLPLTEISRAMSNGLGINTLPNGEPDNESIIEAVAELRKSSNFPMYVHCQYGDDRTGMTVAFHRVYDECWSPQDAESEWKSIAGWWHDVWNFQKHQYFQKVTGDPSLGELYQTRLQQLAPAQ
jgi:hypothetical protein